MWSCCGPMSDGVVAGGRHVSGLFQVRTWTCNACTYNKKYLANLYTHSIRRHEWDEGVETWKRGAVTVVCESAFTEAYVDT